MTPDEWKKRLLIHARDGILPFWVKHSRDIECGGFYPELSHTGEVLNPESPKGLVQHARLLWSFSNAYKVFKDDKYLDLARDAYDFLVRHFKDREERGWFYHVSRQGKPLDTRKHLYAHSFVIYGLSEFFLATGNRDAAGEAYQTFELLNRRALDVKYGGYLECFNRQWDACPQIAEYGVSGDEKTMNTHLHLLEAFTNLSSAMKKLCDSSRQKLVDKHLCHLVDILLDRIYCHERKSLGLYFTPEWKRLPSPLSFGHDIELSWLLQEAQAVTTHRPDDTFMVCMNLANQVKDKGHNPDGSFANELHLLSGEWDRKAIWWVQAEAMVGFFKAFERSKNKAYLETFEKVAEFGLKRLYDKKHGEWQQIPDSPDLPKANLWKTPYHVLRACLEIGA